MARARLYIQQAALNRLDQLHREGLLSAPVWKEVHNRYETMNETVAGELHRLGEEYEELRREEIVVAERDALRAEHGALSDLVRAGMISEDAYHELVGEVYQRRQELEEH